MTLRWALLVALSYAVPLAAQNPCRPCAGILAEDPASIVAALAQQPPLEGEARLYVAWPVTLDAPGDVAATSATLSASGATPWPQAVFRTPSPLLEHLESLERELEAVAEVAQGAGDRASVQIVWSPEGERPSSPSELAYLLKRAAVAIGGANPAARVLVGPLPLDAAALEALYAEDVSAYLDGVVLEPGPGDLDLAIQTLERLDPGRPIALDSVPFETEPALALADAARYAARGVAVTLFDARTGATPDPGPLVLLAREFQGDLSLDPYSVPTGASEAWAFVRGDDLGLRVVVRPPAGAQEMVL